MKYTWPLLLLLSFTLTHAAPNDAQLPLLWDFPRTYTPPPDSFIVTATQAGASPQQFRAALSPPGACIAATKNGKTTDDTFCTLMICPPPGAVVAYWVQAQWGEVFSEQSNIVICWFKPGQDACTCTDPKDILSAPPPPPMKPPASILQTPPIHLITSAEGLNLVKQTPTLPVMTIPPLPTTRAPL
jgi:hypothetical protein